MLRRLGFDVHRCFALRVVMHVHSPRLAAYLAIFHVILLFAATGIERDIVLFAAIRTDNGPGRVGGAVTERKLVVEVIKEVYHGRARFQSLLPRMYTPLTAVFRICVTLSSSISAHGWRNPPSAM